MCLFVFFLCYFNTYLHKKWIFSNIQLHFIIFLLLQCYILCVASYWCNLCTYVMFKINWQNIINEQIESIQSASSLTNFGFKEQFHSDVIDRNWIWSFFFFASPRLSCKFFYIFEWINWIVLQKKPNCIM